MLRLQLASVLSGYFKEPCFFLKLRKIERLAEIEYFLKLNLTILGLIDIYIYMFSSFFGSVNSPSCYGCEAVASTTFATIDSWMDRHGPAAKSCRARSFFVCETRAMINGKNKNVDNICKDVYIPGTECSTELDMYTFIIFGSYIKTYLEDLR